MLVKAITPILNVSDIRQSFVDAAFQRCLEQGLDVTLPPTNMPQHVREMHVRHPDGHVFRALRGLTRSSSVRES